MNIEKIDKNLAVDTSVKYDGIRFFDIEKNPFSIYGVFREGDVFRRMPEAAAKSVNEGVFALHTNTAGGRIRFMTDSKRIVISAVYPPENLGKMSHFALTGSAGFDMYVKDGEAHRHTATFTPPYNITSCYDSSYEFEDKKMREITIHMPLYSSLNRVYIGLSDGSLLLQAPNYSEETPIVYYGSSITQGGCASRPGNSYENIISRRLDINHINLGFSGSAFGEDEMADYIKTLDMKIFVMDYDHNAPTPKHLKETHEKMFKAIRHEKPSLPIVFMTRPSFFENADTAERKKIIFNTYQNALSGGDKNVYYIDNSSLTSYCKGEGTVDGCHPNDYGFYNMADTLTPVIKKILHI